jgi:hypothetical protein
VEQEMRKIRYVVGKVEGPLNLEPDEKVIFAGSCTSWEGEIDGEHVKIVSEYKKPAEVDETKTPSNDMLLKNTKALAHGFRNRSSRHIQIKGCTVSVADNVNYLSSFAGIKNPNFDPRLMIPANIAYWQMRMGQLWNRLFG